MGLGGSLVCKGGLLDFIRVDSGACPSELLRGIRSLLGKGSMPICARFVAALDLALGLSRSVGFTKGSSGGRSARLLEPCDPMQKGGAEQNERRTLQCEFDVGSLEEREHTPEHFSGSCV